MREHGYLASFQMPLPAFIHEDRVPPAVRPLWEHLHNGDVRAAQVAARDLLRERSLSDREALAALLNAAAVCEFRSGNLEEAHRHAKRSAGILPEQWMAHGIRIAVFASQPGTRAYRYLAAAQIPSQPAAWDEPPSPADLHLFAAALAWRDGLWDDVADRLERAFPAGVATMPPDLQSEAFRLAFYRNRPADASAAARALLGSTQIDHLDTILNAMVQHGWTSEALPLYREAFERHASSQLLRRRLVGLCIREGELEEARRLASTGALNIVV